MAKEATVTPKSYRLAALGSLVLASGVSIKFDNFVYTTDKASVQDELDDMIDDSLLFAYDPSEQEAEAPEPSEEEVKAAKLAALRNKTNSTGASRAVTGIGTSDTLTTADTSNSQ